MKSDTSQKFRYAVSAQTARNVFLACCERARREHGSKVFRASIRELAELAGVESITAYRALQCFIAAGYLKRCGHSDVQAGLYAFEKKVLRSDVRVTDGQNNGTFCTIPNDAFARGALGSSGERIWQLILKEKLRVAEIARRLKLSHSTVSRVLKKMTRFGLAQKVGRLWQGNVVDEKFLKKVAKECGTAGKAERRKAKHEIERSRFVTALILQRKREWERKQYAGFRRGN